MENSKKSKSKIQCAICDSTFGSNTIYRRHVRKKHPEKDVDEVAPPLASSGDKMHECSKCKKKFTTKKYLQYHQRKVHKIVEAKKIIVRIGSKKQKAEKKVKEKAPRPALNIDESEMFPCSKCQKKFVTKKYMQYHQRKVHKLISRVGAKKTCPLCSNSFIDLIGHFEEEHNVTIEKEEVSFASQDEFFAWKTQVEENTHSFFANRKKKVFANGSVCIKYECNRSGKFISKGEGKRNLRTKGSRKIGGSCPAEMKANIAADGQSCNITFYKTHVGHTNELIHLNLPKKDRHDLAEKIASGAPLENILHEVVDSAQNNLTPKCMLTRKHLMNIGYKHGFKSKEYQIGLKAGQHKNDASTIEAWVNGMENSNCILTYKPQGVEMNGFEKGDFILIIMTNPQVEMAKKYGSDCICVDCTKLKGFDLVTLLVVDDLCQGFPVGFLASNRSDQVVLSYFYKCVLQRVGRRLSPKIFMSDLADSFLCAWMEVMGSAPQKRLYCTWLVDKAWRTDLKKIQSKSKQQSIYKVLCSLMEERDVERFKRMLGESLRNFAEDPELFSFYTFFNEKYVKSVSCWAECFRFHWDLNTNMHFESIHKVIKQLYPKGRNGRTLDKAMTAILQFVTDKLSDRNKTTQNERLTPMLINIQSRHKESFKMSFESISRNETSWSVASPNEQCIVKDDVENCQCPLVCIDCRSCIHKYTCSCIDSNIKGNMCIHIHLVCQYVEKLNKKSSPKKLDDMQENDAGRILESLISNEPRRLSNTNTFEDKKNGLLKELTVITSGLSNEAELEVVRRHIALVNCTLAAMRKQNSLNKQIETQRNFHVAARSFQTAQGSLMKPPCEEGPSPFIVNIQALENENVYQIL